MTARRRLRRLMRMLLPWAPKADRRAAIDQARGEKEQSQRDAAHARDIEEQLHRMQAQNHWAATIAGALGIQNGERGK